MIIPKHKIETAKKLLLDTRILSKWEKKFLTIIVDRADYPTAQSLGLSHIQESLLDEIIQKKGHHVQNNEKQETA